MIMGLQMAVAKSVAEIVPKENFILSGRGGY